MIGHCQPLHLSYGTSFIFNAPDSKTSPQPIKRSRFNSAVTVPKTHRDHFIRRNTLAPLNAFKVSTRVPPPLSQKETETLISRLKPFIQPSVVPLLSSDPLMAQRILYIAGSKMVQQVKNINDLDRIPIGLAVYQQTEKDPKLLKMIQMPVPYMLTEATHPVSQAAYGISLLRADLPRHLPPAFITKFLEPIWQFYARKHDKALYKPGDELQYLKKLLSSGQPDSHKSKEALEFLPEEYDQLLLNAHSIPLGLKVTDEPSLTNYGTQLFRMWDEIIQAFEVHANKTDESNTCKLGIICLNTKTGQLDYQDMTEPFANLWQSTPSSPTFEVDSM